MSDYNILHAARDAVTGQLRYVSEGVQQSRLAICDTCEHKRGLVCGKCGCVLKGKTRLAKSSCPVGKWEAIVSEATVSKTTDIVIVLTSTGGTAPSKLYPLLQALGVKIQVRHIHNTKDLAGAFVVVIEDRRAAEYLANIETQKRPRVSVWMRGRLSDDPDVSGFSHSNLPLDRATWEALLK